MLSKLKGQFLPTVLILLFSAQLNAQTEFGSDFSIDIATFQIDSKVFDLDGDGNQDILCSYYRSGEFLWYRNEGDGSYSLEKLISANAAGASSIYAEDLDGDGDLDVMSAAFSDDKIAWYENLGGGEFSSENTLSTTADGASSVYSEDMDGDGDMDVLSASWANDEIAWYENLGDGNFSLGITISTDASAPQSVHADDLDGDGDMDVLAASLGDDKIIWYENLGNGNFSAQMVISNNADGAKAAFSVDLDGDGDLDVISCSLFDHKIAWYENLGEGTFSSEIVISLTSNGIRSIYSKDLDGDGDMDVLGTSDLDDTVSWFENLGDGSFSSENVLSENVDGACSVYSDDLDNDGDMDIVSASAFDGKIAWYENLGDGNFSDEMIVSTNGKNVLSVHSTDLDGDGDIDVLTSTENTHKIAWYENLGNGTFSPQRVISRNAKGINSVFSDDLDGDGDMDVLSTSFDDNKIVWYENLGNGNLSDELIISSNTGGAFSVYTEDLDGDGDMDILSAAYLGDRVEWHENLGNGNFSDRIVISDNADGVCSVYSEDLDGDGDMDVLSASPNDDKIAWYENLGEGNFSSQIIISANAGAPASVYSADLDQDGDMDVLSASLSDDKVVWYENLGDGIFSDELILSNNAERATSVYSEDLDGDGDMDVMSASFSDSKIAWYENLGNGVFSSELILSTTQNWAEQVLSADMDGDGDMDVLSVGSGQGQVTWFENLAGEGCINPDACNFNPDAFIENGTCCLGVCGCMDIYSANYNQDAVCDNGSCIFGISGIVFYDENENGEFDEVDEEYPLANQEIVIQPLDWTAFTNDEGEFTLNDIPAGNYDVSLVNTDLFPFSTTSNPLSISVGQESSEVMMGVSNELPQADLSVIFYNDNGIGYPCDDWVYHAVCFMNEGNYAMDGLIEVELDSLFQDYSEFTPIDSVVGNTIYMSFENLLPGQSYCPFFDLLTPNADFFGETISSTARVYGMLDGTQVAYGEDELNVLMTCAYDPNDKQVFPNGYEEPHFVLNETELEYLIRFQNTGNAFATNVLVTDTIDENLNLETFSLVSNSHSVQTSIKPEERVIEFLFENIMLPDSGANEPESHGLISFMISPYEGLIPGTELNNTGNIFFDNNPPIITNTTWSTIYECTNALANVQDYNDVICPHAEIQLENNNQFIENYLWTSGGVSIGTESILIGSLQPGYSEIQLVVSNPICEASTSIPFQLLDSPEIITSEDQSICVGEEVTISAESEFDLVWAELIGGNEHTLSPEETSVYSVSTSSPDFECETISLITITVIPYPDAQFSANGIVLTANAGDAYQWFINSEPIEGATDQTLTIEEDGNYSVEISNGWDCSTTSEEQFINYVGISEISIDLELQIFPNPAREEVRITLPFNSGTARLFDGSGKLIKSFVVQNDIVNLSVASLSDGVYHFSVVSNNGTLVSGRLLVIK